MELIEAARLPAAEVVQRLGSSPTGLTTAEASRRLAEHGPNALRGHGAHPWRVLGRQLQSPLLMLLVAVALVSLVVGEHADAVIVLAIIALSVGLGFVNEFRSERTIERLHARIRHRSVVLRDGSPGAVDVTELVPGDVVRLQVGDIVPADLRLLEVHALECDEAVLTGESAPAAKRVLPVTVVDSPLQLTSCAFMGTVVAAGGGTGLVVITGPATAFGRIAGALGRSADETGFQRGLRRFSGLLVRVTVILAASIFVIDALLRRPLLDSALFSLAIAVGLTPQLLPAIVSVSLSYGAERLARRSVLVKRLVSIEDLGNVEVLFTDKTGTLTEGRLTFSAALDAAGRPSPQPLALGLACNAAIAEGGRVVGGNPLDRALWAVPGAADLVAGVRRLDEVPFDHERRLMSVLVEWPGRGRLLLSKGAPEAVLERCVSTPEPVRAALDAAFAAGARVVAVASRPAPDREAVAASDERDLELAGLLIFDDPIKRDAAAALARLARLGIEVKVVTGDNDQVARQTCLTLGLRVTGVLTGSELDRIDDRELARRLPLTTIFARVTPEQKSRILRAQRRLGADVAFLGDGVNDAVALHDADVGISVDSASDVAREAADVVLLEKDLDILADGVVEGRRIFGNTIKYVLMGTSSNFGNMFSAAGASLVLDFLPMTATQILLNNFLYDVGEMTIPTDRVDEELLRRPAHWDLGMIERFMVVFGPISSLFDFLTFGVMLWGFHAHHALFQTGWFVESLATQTLIIFVIRTRRTPSFRSRPSLAMAVTSLACALVGAALPFTPLGTPLGFTPLPPPFYLALGAMVAAYLVMVEAAKVVFYRWVAPPRPLATPLPRRIRVVRRWALRWTHRHHRPGSPAAGVPHP
ncbi:MAG TPA: magnesium-translocating P-type ATPase [Candidatus Dormibacteraeota bacterium]|nr:magnesium-translocating P-type ATPase [Candidatus Dormibacteraeota bacterium]